MELSPNDVSDSFIPLEKHLTDMHITEKQPQIETEINGNVDIVEEKEREPFRALENAPTEIMLRIFSNFNVKERSNASRVCWRWNHLLTSSKCVMDDVVVFNVFEQSVWETSLSQNRGVRVTAFHVPDMTGLRTVLDLVSASCSVKLWYKDVEFAKQCIDTLSSTEMKMKCVDLYPYSPDLAVEHLFDKLPQLKGLTMRPHGTQYFWDGLPLPSLPAFENLTTLVLDSFNLMDTTVLPSTLTTLEYLNRKGKNYMDLLPKLHALPKLEYFSLSHADMSEKDNFLAFLNAVDNTVLPSLSYMILRFCKFADLDPTENQYLDDVSPERVERKMSLKMLKFDLCYGSLEKASKTFLSITKSLSILSINVMADLAPVTEVMQVSRLLENEKVWLHFGVLQRDSTKEGTANVFDGLEVPVSLHRVMTKFEASFVDRSDLLDKILLGPIAACQELKLIQCTALELRHLESVAEKCVLLRKFSCINCDRGRTANIDEGMRNFVKCFDDRKSRHLQIIWKRSVEQSRPAGFFLDIVHSHQILLKGKVAKFYSKTFSEENDGETVIIWNKNKKKLVIQDYSEPDSYRVVGVIIPTREVEEIVEEPSADLEESVRQIEITG